MLSWEIQRHANNAKEEKNYWEKVTFSSAQGTEILLPFKKAKQKIPWSPHMGWGTKSWLCYSNVFVSHLSLQTLCDSISQNSGLLFPSQLHRSAELKQAHTGAEAKENLSVGLQYCCATELLLFAVLLIDRATLTTGDFGRKEATILICDVSSTFITNKSLDRIL